MSVINKIILNGIEYDIGSTGSSVTESLKTALLQLAEKVVYIDENGQDYYDELQAALYPPADLVSISAVYTQVGTIYDTDTLDDLKPNLVVTAHMSDSTTRVVTDYILSGTLTAGASTITVTYAGLTTTFNVVVTKYALYPLENGTYTFSNGNTVTVTNGKHVEITLVETLKGWADISDITENTATWDTADNVKNHNAKFTIPANATAVFTISNYTYVTPGLPGPCAFNAFDTGTSTLGMDIQDLTTQTGSSTKTFVSAADVGCLFAVPTYKGSYSFDVSFVVDGIRYV